MRMRRAILRGRVRRLGVATRLDAEASGEDACGNDAVVVRVDALVRRLIFEPRGCPADKGSERDQ
jgi:hypothetical protein